MKKESSKRGSMIWYHFIFQVNGIPGHANSYYINDILKGELGFKGFTVSDWQDVQRLVYFIIIIAAVNILFLLFTKVIYKR